MGAIRSRPARVVIADDHELVRAGLRGTLEAERDLVVVGEAADGAEAVELCHREQPDVVLMDVRMPGTDGLEATRAIKRELPGTSVLVVTMQENSDYLYEAMRAGVAGYVLKDASRQELVGAVRRALSGEPLLDPRLASRLLKRLASESQGPTTPAIEALTRRELDVLRQVAQGLTNREIAERLLLSPATVKVHVEHIIAKLGVSDRTQAAVRAVELGLLHGDGPP